MVEHCEVVTLPISMIEYCERYAGNVQTNVNYTDALNGYGVRKHISVIVSRYAEWCTRPNCKYHSIFSPWERGEKCNRHSIERGYINVFYWEAQFGGKSLEEAWEDFLKEHNDE